MKPIWTKSHWKKEELDGKLVAFRFPVKGGWVEGIGEFLISRNPKGLLFVQIVVTRQGRNWAERIQTLYQIPQTGVDRIVQHPNQEIAAFRLA
jgi:hypothetical protein